MRIKNERDFFLRVLLNKEKAKRAEITMVFFIFNSVEKKFVKNLKNIHP